MDNVIAIDGPAGAGKSTVAKLVAQRLSIYYLDSGAMYRAITYYCILNNIPPTEDKIKNLIDNIQFEMTEKEIIVNGINTTPHIRDDVVNKNVSLYAKIPILRRFLVEKQREFVSDRENPVIIDGRDIGSYVFPNARIKIYLDAAVEERARRRLMDAKEKGRRDIKEIIEDIKRRDENDRNRDFAPLKKAEDAIYIDTTNMGVEDVVNTVIGIIKEKISG